MNTIVVPFPRKKKLSAFNDSMHSIGTTLVVRYVTFVRVIQGHFCQISPPNSMIRDNSIYNRFHIQNRSKQIYLKLNSFKSRDKNWYRCYLCDGPLLLAFPFTIDWLKYSPQRQSMFDVTLCSISFFSLEKKWPREASIGYYVDL